ncbi:MAG: amino acid adenylation domain-containing protein [Blastocatellia bacterium]|nr:amino acid adenylation domain-containing protein [Blastocatellia bacterium]
MLLRGPSRPDFLLNECLPDIFFHTAQRCPQHPALVWGEQVVTYGQLEQAGNLVATALCHQGAQPGKVIGLFLPRGANLLIGQIGISFSGAAWLPFDAETPLDRVQTCLTASQSIGLVTCRVWVERLRTVNVPVWAIEDLLATGDASPLPRRAQPTDPAYVIYTSGSTGLPKGIVISHASICHFLRSENEVLGVNENDRVYQGFSLAFDMSFEEIWISYLVGATLWIAPPQLVTDPDGLAQAITTNNLTVLHAVPTLMGLISAPLPTLRVLNLGGEACPDALVEQVVRPGRKVFNTYGPTEATVSATVERLVAGRQVTIGMPLPNYELMVVDEQLRPLPAGAVGEICIAGPGLALGYLGRADLTAEKFVEQQLCPESSHTRWYRTGDLGRMEPGGPLHCLGRVDSQVKIRGFRVELGEIEALLAAAPGIKAAAAVVRPVAEVEQLVAFVVADGNASEPEHLRRELMLRVPPYMVPARIEALDQLPRLTSGKVDRKALVSLPLHSNGTAAATSSALPRNEEERTLYSILEKLFPGCSLHPEADFFNDLGGHSLLAAKLVSLLRKDVRYTDLSVREIYSGSRLEEIAAAMHRSQHRETATRTFIAIPSWKRRLCGLAQALIVPILVFLRVAEWLFPFFVYHIFTGDEGDTVPVAAFYSVVAFVLAKLAVFTLAIGGKWLISGRLKAGCFPLWGWKYFRWWLSNQLCELPPVYLLTGTPLLNWYLQALGARIGKDVVIDSVHVGATDLLTIGDGSSIGTEVFIENARVEGGVLVMGPVTLGQDAVVDSYAVLENDSVLGNRSRLGGLSSLPAGYQVPDGENWEGTPARPIQREEEPLPPRPRITVGVRLSETLLFALASLGVAVLYFMPVFPSFMLIDWVDVHFLNIFEEHTNLPLAFGLFFLLSIPASIVLVTATILLSAGFRHLFIPRQREGIFPVYGLEYFRKWLMNRMLDSSLGVLHGLYASVYAPGWLRLMGAKVGKGSEVSTAAGIIPDLLELGQYSFIADGVLLGDEEQRGGWMVLKTTRIGNNSFVGNGAYVSDGAAVPDNVLIGVQTRTPDNHLLKSGQTWLGSPPILLPARENLTGFNQTLTFTPSAARKLGRAVVEMMRVVLPLAFIIASGYLMVQVVLPVFEEGNWLESGFALGAAGLVYGIASFLLVLGLKWLLIGRYVPRAVPMWSPFVWLSEAVTNVYESLAVPNLLTFLRGTPMLPWAIWLMGAKIGQGVYLNTTDFTEFDCVKIGDQSELNPFSGPQTHLFEDRVMKIGRVEIGKQVTVGSCSTILYDTQVGDRVFLGPMTLVAKGECLPSDTCWEGSPALAVAHEPDLELSEP